MIEDLDFVTAREADRERQGRTDSLAAPSPAVPAAAPSWPPPCPERPRALSTPVRVLIVDDHPVGSARALLQSTPGYAVVSDLFTKTGRRRPHSSPTPAASPSTRARHLKAQARTSWAQQRPDSAAESRFFCYMNGLKDRRSVTGFVHRSCAESGPAQGLTQPRRAWHGELRPTSRRRGSRPARVGLRGPWAGPLVPSLR